MNRSGPGIRVMSALVGGALLLASPTQSQQPTTPSPSEVAELSRQVLESAYPAGEPGAVALVARGEDVLYRGASGMANLELGVPLAPDMVFEIGSITKQFTAAAIMILAEAGKLSLDDPLTRFIPDYPETGAGVTVEHLLTHTSGIVSYTGIPGYMATEVRKDVTVRELIDVFKDEPVEFLPGARWAYNNSGYVLLGAIIEEVSGKRYADFIRERIFEPLGMTGSYYGSHTRIIPRRAPGYGGDDDDGYVNANFLSMTQPYSAGALMSTVDDLHRWTLALHGGEVVSELSLRRMTTPYVLSDGDTTTYGYGLGIGEVRGHRAVRHGGGIFGYVTDALYIPAAEVFVAVLSNNTASDVGPDLVATKLAAIALGDPYPEFEAVALDEAALHRYVGVYRIDEETERVVTVENGHLYTQRTGGSRIRAYPSSQTHFFYQSSLSHFEFVLEAGKVTKMLMYQGGAEEPEVAVKVSDEVPTPESVELDPAILDRYVGVYELRPGFDLEVTREGDMLVVQATGQPPARLFARSETEFFMTAVDAQISFVANEAGEFDQLILHQGGRDMPARRKE